MLLFEAAAGQPKASLFTSRIVGAEPLLQEMKGVSSELLRLLEELEDLGLHALYGHAAFAGEEPH